MKNRKMLKSICCIALCAVMLLGLVPAMPARASGTPAAAYVAYYEYLKEESESIGKPIRDEDYYKMLTERAHSATLDSILGAYLLDINNDGIEDLILIRKGSHKSSAQIDYSSKKWLCVYSYVNGELKRIAQSERWAKSNEGKSWSYYEPENYLGSYSTGIFYCISPSGKVYFSNWKPDYVEEGRGLKFYEFGSGGLSEVADFVRVFIPDWDLGWVESDYGRYSYKYNNMSVTYSQFTYYLDQYRGNWFQLEANDYTEVLNTLKSKVESYYIPSSWAAVEVNMAINNGYVPKELQCGYTQPITRGEFCALAAQFYEAVTGKEITARKTFSDTDSVSVQKMGGLGIVNGVSETEFAPNKSLTRQEAATMLRRLGDSLRYQLPQQSASFADNASIAKWAIDAVGTVSAAGVMGGTGNNMFSPLGSYTREQAIMTIGRLAELPVNGEEPKPEPEPEPKPEPLPPSDSGLGNFKKAQSYAGQFTDVAASAWYAPNVAAAYEYGLMNGSTATTFNPSGNLTLAEALVIACRIHNIYYDNNYDFSGGSPWYQSYVDYAIDKGIIAAGTYQSYTIAASRMDFARFLAASVSEGALPAINNVGNGIPDVPPEMDGAKAVYLLYNAGILTGSGAAGDFKPASSITRAEVSAIITRIADPTLRKTFTLAGKEVPATEIKLDQERVGLYIGESGKINVEVLPSNASNKNYEITVSNSGVLELHSDGSFRALAAGVATITVKIGNIEEQCVVEVAKSQEHVFTGKGYDWIRDIYLDQGVYILEYSQTGKATDIIDIDCLAKNIISSGSYDLLSDSGSCSGATILTVANKGATTFDLEVDSDGEWTVIIKKLVKTGSSNISGSGNMVSGIFKADAGESTITYSLSNDIQVYAIGIDSPIGSSLFWDTDEGSGKTKHSYFSEGKWYALAVISRGDWAVDLGFGDELQYVK